MILDVWQENALRSDVVHPAPSLHLHHPNHLHHKQRVQFPSVATQLPRARTAKLRYNRERVKAWTAEVP